MLALQAQSQPDVIASDVNVSKSGAAQECFVHAHMYIVRYCDCACAHGADPNFIPIV